MKKIMFMFLFLFLLIPNVKANSIYNNTMEIYIDGNGDAYIQEIWEGEFTEYTENYKTYYNLGNSVIDNFTVEEDNKVYTYINDWNYKGSFEDKKYKNGFNYTNDGVELCWGISSYGYHKYVLKYRIKNFVLQTADSQIVYWTLIPKVSDISPDNISIKIYSDFKYNMNNNVWGFGNSETSIYTGNGDIYLNTENKLVYDEYITVLAKFDQNTFNIVANITENDFKYYYNMAMENVEKKSQPELEEESYNNEDMFLVYWILGCIIIPFSFILYQKLTVNNKMYRNVYFGKNGRKLPKNIEHYRDIPCDKNIYLAYWMAINYNLVKRKTDFLGTIILKWIYEGKVTIKNEDDKSKKSKYALILSKDFKSEIKLEETLYGDIYKASIDGVLESREFKKWCRKNSKKILKWFDKILDYGKELLRKDNKIHKSKILKIDEVDECVYYEAICLKGLKLFLNKFTRIEEKEAIEVHLWKEYLMFAQIFGIADKVAKQFKNLYPDTIVNYEYSDYLQFIDDIMTDINNFSHSIERENKKNDSNDSSYYSSSDSSSSSGGGGGSFGGGTFGSR